MKQILFITLLLIHSPQVIAEITFGFPHVNQLSDEDSKFINERIIPIPLLTVNPTMNIEEVFKLFPKMNQDGDRGPRGRDYTSRLPDSHFFTYLKVQKDRKGIHNISFNSAFTKPSVEEVQKTANWLLTIFGEPSLAFTHDSDKNNPGDEHVALAWIKEGITVVLSLSYASGVHARIFISRNNTRVEDLVATSNKKNISTKSLHIMKEVNLWATSVAKLDD